MSGEEFMERYILACVPPQPAANEASALREPEDVMSQIDKIRTMRTAGG